MSMMATSKRSPLRSHSSACAGDSVSRGSMPQRAVCSDRILRLVALSSTTNRRLPESAGCSPAKLRRVFACGISAKGAPMVKRKVEPCPGPALSTHIVPPISSASRLLMAKPRPVPPYLRVVELSAWLKLWNSLVMPAALRPMPVSRTANSSCGWPLSTVLKRTVNTTSPFSVNLTELDNRFSRICRSRVTSPLMATGTSPSNS